MLIERSWSVASSISISMMLIETNRDANRKELVGGREREQVKHVSKHVSKFKHVRLRMSAALLHVSSFTAC
jgi:hypothetical protein